jgi:hypothetical protein
MVNADRSSGLWVERRCAIDQKHVLMVAMGQRHLDKSPTIDPPLHRERIRVPIVEISDQTHRFGFGLCKIEIDWLNHVPCRVGARV